MPRSLLLFTLTLILYLLTCIFTTSTAAADANQVVAAFHRARQARKIGMGMRMATNEHERVKVDQDSSIDFEARRAALLAQAAENAPLERDIEWEQQLLTDRRSVHFSRDRSIMDDDVPESINQHITQHVAGVRPADL